MARFLCAIHAPDATPTAFALVEVTDGPTYVLRDLRAVAGEDATQTILHVVSSEPQYAGQTTFVATGGQRAVDALHEHGPSAAAVTLTDGGSGDTDSHVVSVQVLVDTFERLYRAGAVEAPGSNDAASAAIDAMYSAADLEAAAPDSDRDAEGDIDEDVSNTLSGDAVPGSGPSPSVIEQSGSAANESTEVISSPLTPAEASAMAVESDVHVGRIASSTAGAAPDLGEHADTAIAFALACWYGEASRDGLPQTDKADEAQARRTNRS